MQVGGPEGMHEALTKVILLLGSDCAFFKDKGDAPGPLHGANHHALQHGSEEASGILK